MSRLLDLIDEYNQTRPEGEPPLNKTRLAEAAGISRPTLNAIEQGRIGLLRPVQSVADILGVDVQEFIHDAAVVSLLRTLGARPIPEGAQDRSWETVKQIIPATGECDSLTASRLSSFTTGRRS